MTAFRGMARALLASGANPSVQPSQVCAWCLSSTTKRVSSIVLVLRGSPRSSFIPKRKGYEARILLQTHHSVKRMFLV